MLEPANTGTSENAPVAGPTTMPVRPPGSWSSTLRLPKSAFPPRPLPANRDRYLKACTDDLYTWQRRERAAQTPFVLHDGPPYANGSLHIGHALNKILKDLILRTKIQGGSRVTYVPGWDCHGLPIEIKALEKQREHGEHTMDAVAVRRFARDLAETTVDEQKKGFKEWAIMGDWDKAWRTMDKGFEIQQLNVFRAMAKKGLIFRRYKPVYWSPSSRTALAEAELEYKVDHVSTAAFVQFKVTSVPAGLREKMGEMQMNNLYAVIWTTTPWTLPANRAIAVHSDLEYVVVKSGGKGLIVAHSRVPELMKILDKELPLAVWPFLGKELEGATYVNSLRGKEAVEQPVIHADFVSADSGTGVVHLAPGHGMDDYEVCMRLGIEAAAPVNDVGHFTSAALPDDPQALEGKPVLGAGGKAVLELLGNNVLATHKYKHKYPYDWRTKLPVITRATEQWFSDVGSVKNQALEALQDVNFLPEKGRARLESFVKGRSEWCISRQRAWGVPIPALYDEDGVAVLTDESVAHIIAVIDKKGVDAWWTDAADDPAWVVPGLNGTYRRGKDTMDVWFDSGTSWTQTEEQADVYLEGSDQHRGWFQSSLLTHTSASGRAGAPFKTLITHGFTLDKKGKKMSKSIGNTIAPSQIMDGTLLPPYKARNSKIAVHQAMGADALRLWVASSDYTRDVVIGTPVLKFNQSALLKYRMIIKMLLGSMQTPLIRDSPVTKLDQIALVQLQAVMHEVQTAYLNYEFYKAVNAINRWINTDLSAFYLEAMKDRLYCGDGGGVLEEIFHGLLKMLAPITPNLVEEAWDYRPQWMKASSQTHPSLRPLTEPVFDAERCDVAELEIRDEVPILLAANTAIKTAQEEARGRKLIGSSLESSVVLTLPPKLLEVFERYTEELASIFVVSSVQLVQEKATDEATVEQARENKAEGLSAETAHEAFSNQAELVLPAANPSSSEQPQQETSTSLRTQSAWTFSSTFSILGEKASVTIFPPKAEKCPRCWQFVAEEDNLCGRCKEVVKDVKDDELVGLVV
ncbi:Isoleucine--tRNA ligase, mitochondrial [Lachnellula hyalina]|uniref:Isoleucine--tRNA ligase, mitochondrial n=1 Tax=Lachnellula hyalina TaxID=1316788 RepID=A0A8H8R438_9HELO|nr:Isoleucine--tRNA ligase, mitochondrial [Lachnellula hyalina]TVY27998.1 Isoleucine--tRNA ligase, mitochondrial [Lachnellula hyalina]